MWTKEWFKKGQNKSEIWERKKIKLFLERCKLLMGSLERRNYRKVGFLLVVATQEGERIRRNVGKIMVNISNTR